MKARIRVDAFASETLDGTVIEVSPLPDSTNFCSPDIKVYTTKVRIDQPLPGLGPGMTAEVEILVSELDNVLSVPVEAVVHYDDKDHVAVKKPDGGDRVARGDPGTGQRAGGRGQAGHQERRARGGQAAGPLERRTKARDYAARRPRPPRSRPVVNERNESRMRATDSKQDSKIRQDLLANAGYDLGTLPRPRTLTKSGKVVDRQGQRIADVRVNGG